MANRRMFSKDVVDSDRFLDMAPTAQNLYFHLGMHADDDGFVSSPKKVKRACSATDDDLKMLEAKNFIIAFENGVIIISEWKLNNYIQKDRYTPSIHLSEKEHIITTENRTYKYVDTPCIQDVSDSDTQYSIEQSSIDQFSKGQISREQRSIEQDSKDKASLEDSEKNAYAVGFSSFSLNDCLAYYVETFDAVGDIDRNTLNRLGERYGFDFLYEAMTKTAFREDVKSPLAYITALLKEWQEKGFTTVDDIQDEQEAFNEQLSQSDEVKYSVDDDEDNLPF
ncbi:DnaD domain protein [Enterococcus sp. AZ196]|uniref:DnaD domain protein n=1 Tax=Enterococcus sp. AZ196 TaxID=2774659 RepID=UPI003D29731C